MFNDIKDQSPLTKEQISEELDNGWVEGAPEFSSFRTDSSNMRKDFDKYTRARKVFSDKTAEELISSAFGKLPFCVEYSDDSTYGSSLEHGDLFNNITNFRISKH